MKGKGERFGVSAIFGLCAEGREGAIRAASECPCARGVERRVGGSGKIAIFSSLPRNIRVLSPAMLELLDTSKSALVRLASLPVS
jgi:hypothetical protein